MKPTSVEFTSDGFGAPKNVRINGTPVHGVESIDTEHRTEEFAEVIIRLRYVRLEVQP